MIFVVQTHWGPPSRHGREGEERGRGGEGRKTKDGTEKVGFRQENHTSCATPIPCILCTWVVYGDFDKGRRMTMELSVLDFATHLGRKSTIRRRLIGLIGVQHFVHKNTYV
jgi:hypothetical protein